MRVGVVRSATLSGTRGDCWLLPASMRGRGGTFSECLCVCIFWRYVACHLGWRDGGLLARCKGIGGEGGSANVDVRAYALMLVCVTEINIVCVCARA